MKIAVFFPGIGYRFEKPLLYYSKKLAKECGYDTLVDVDYQIRKTANIRGNAKKMQEAFEEACASAEKFLAPISWKEYDEIVFISKSIGTAVAAHFTNFYHLQAKQIYYTPLAQTFLAEPTPGIAFCGTADPWVPEPDAVLCQCAKAHIQSYRIEGVNHSLEGNDTMKNIEILQQVMRRTKEYLQENRSG
ncbi:putative uncharacterized protein [Roseburia sp. CAG:309]|nr:putative uncharacterized protein [Roseburia sp. CAG:309]